MSSYYMRKSTYQKDFTSKLYRKVTTYRHDYNQGQAPGYDRSDELMKRIDYSRPPKFSDPVWQRGRNESSEQYEQRLQEMSKDMKPDYYRTYEERKVHDFYPSAPRPEDYHGGQADRHGYTDYNKARERYHYEQDVFDRRRRGVDTDDAPRPEDYRNGGADRFGFTDYERAKAHYLGYSDGYEQRRYEHDRRQTHERMGQGYPDGSQTDRGDYNKDSFYDRGNLTYRRNDRNYEQKKKDLYQYKDYVNNRAMADYVIVEKEYDRYRPTQKDYGAFETTPKIDDMPRAYRGQFDKQLDAFQNKPQEAESQPYYQQQHQQQRHEPPPRDDRVPPGHSRDDRENRATVRDDPQARRDINKIEMHEGNFKPYASNYYEDKLRGNNKVREQNLSFDTSAHPIPPPHIEYKPTGNLELPAQNESGVYMLIRANASDLDEVKKSFQKHKTILKMSGHLTGIATADQVQVDGDYTNWTQRSAILMVLWFPSAKAAENWMVYDSDFKIASFPYPNGADIVIVPVNYIPPNDERCTTFVMTEYPEIRNPEYFRTEIIEPMRDILRGFNCEPFVVRTNGVLVERGCWINPKSSVTVHRFVDTKEANRFQNDSRVSLLKGKLNGVTRGGRYTTIRFTLNFLI